MSKHITPEEQSQKAAHSTPEGLAETSETLPSDAISLRVPPLDDKVWTGFFKKFRDWVSPTTEAPFEMQFAVANTVLGMAVGRSVGIYNGRSLYPNSFTLLLGPTGQPRKTTLVSRLMSLLQEAFGTTDPLLRVVHGTG